MLLGKTKCVAALVATSMLMGSLAGATQATTGGPIPVPSGMDVRWLETISDNQGPGGLTLRFRFVAPAVANSVSADQLANDMETLCNDFALARVPKNGPRPAQIVISVADAAQPFGQASAAIHQYFEAYSVNNNACVWELF